MSEFDWIDRYLKPLARSREAMGLENDVAVLCAPGEDRTTIVTMDTIVEGVHFLKEDPLETVSRKLVRVNVSDAICKGGVPKQALLSMALPAWFDESAMRAFTEGLSVDLDAFGVNLIGGDIVSTAGPLVLTLALTAETGASGPTLRSGARSGDLVYVTGRIGEGLTGLEAAQTGEPANKAAAYRIPQIPPVEIAGLIARFASASIDVSDGLISEALHICQASACGMHIDLEKVAWSEPDPVLPRMLALVTAGDDYQTLMTVASGKQAAFEARAAESEVELSLLGRIECRKGLRLFLNGQSVELPANAGFRHAKRD